MTELCKFFKNGDIIYKDINLISLSSTNIFADITNSEIINGKDVFINKSFDIYYHKFQYGSSYTFLEWKKSKDNDWEWFKCDINETTLLSLDSYLNKSDKVLYDIQLNEEYNEEFKQNLKYNILIFLNKYNLDETESTNILNKLNIDNINLK